MYKTHVTLGNASTAHGMRRILKHLPPVQKYIRQAVEAGIYYKEPQQPGDRRRPPPKRTLPYGTSIQDYPVDYQILTLHPPIPPKPRVPKKFQPPKPKLPTERLAKKYLQKQQTTRQQQQQNDWNREYYEKILGIPSSQNKNSSNSMGFKSHQINKAYAVAMKQYQVMRTSDGDLSEDEALEIVEQMLKDENIQERQASRKLTKQIVEECKHQEETKHESTTETIDSNNNESNDDLSSLSIPSVLHSKPHTIQGMTIWSQRLATIPYQQWTVGATTALDHWIARSVLNWDEDTWQLLLEGIDPTLKSRGHDVIAARHALFPETNNLQEQDEYDDTDDLHEESSTTDTEKTIDELLASLGAYDDDDDDEQEQQDEKEDEGDLDAKVAKLVEELQAWRIKHADTPYQDWITEDQEEFGNWLEKYVATLTPDNKGGDDDDKVVDMDKTREALLAVPPMTREESDDFWSHLSDEAAAAEWLQSVDISNLPPDASRVLQAFQELPFETRVQKLVELGTLEPLWNEYTPESVRIQFLQRHYRKLLHDLDMEHLVPDPRGPVTANDMGEAWMELHGIVNKDQRFAIQRMPYKESEYDYYLEEYTTHKAGRARFEEFMFQKGKLGLQYGDKPNEKDDDDDLEDEES